MNHVIKIFSITVLMVVSFFFLSILTVMIPKESIKNHVQESMDIIEKEGIKYRIGDIFFFRLDNFTDALMINIAMGVNDSQPVKSAIQNTYYLQNENSSIIKATLDIADDNYQEVYAVPYPRYWHGYQLILRPLLYVTNYKGIRIINSCCFVGLLCIIFAILIKRKEWQLLVALMITFLLMNIWIVPLSIQFSISFYIALLGIVFLLYKRIVHFNHLIVFFTIIGGLTSYFDLLSVPLLTLCLPLIVCLYLSSENNNDKYKYMVYYSLCWFFSYSIVWISKWVIAHFIVGYPIQDAIQQAILRVSTEYDGFDMSIKGIIDYLMNYPSLLMIGIVMLLIFMIMNIFLCIRNKKNYQSESYLLVIALMPVIWCLVLRNHSIIHIWFVWRIFTISVVAYTLFILRYFGLFKSNTHLFSKSS